MKPQIKTLLAAAIHIWLGVALCHAADGRLRFYAKPYRVFEGDAVRFIYFEQDDAIPKSQITYWEWDFNNDGAVDASGTDYRDIDQTWYAVLNPSLAVNGLQLVGPVLRVTTTQGASYSVTNITENTHGNEAIDSNLEIYSRAAGNADIQVNFSGNPRLATPGTQIRFFADIRKANSNVLDWIVSWNFGDDGADTGSNPSHTYTAINSYTVDIRVDYRAKLQSGAVVTNSLTRTNVDFIRIVANGDELTLGRAYRRGFPEEYDWDDIIKAYSASGIDDSGRTDSYVYYHYFEKFYERLLAGDAVHDGLRLFPNQPDRRLLLTETVNEILQGQSLLGNQRLIDALRIKYPVIFGFDPDNPPDRLPVPPGVREETAAIDVALLDYYAALLHVFNAVQEFGTDILRSHAQPGREPFPDFPRYITTLEPTLSQQPIPIKNEFWQLTSLLDKLALGTVEKAKRLFRLSLAEPVARQESKEECKRAGLQGYLGMALLAAGQSPEDFALNEGNSLLAHVKNARDLFEQINAGLNPLGNDGSFIPNESFSATFQDAQEAVSDAREAEINARQESRTYDHYQADLRNEQQSQRAQFITPLRNLTGLDPADYNNLATIDDQIDFKNTLRTRVATLESAYHENPNVNVGGLGEFGSAVLQVIDAEQSLEQTKDSLRALAQKVKIETWRNTRVNIATESAADELAALDLFIGIQEGLLHDVKGTATTTFNLVAGLQRGLLQGEREAVQAIQTMTINDINSEAQIRTLLLDQVQIGIAIQRAKTSLDQAKLRISTLESTIDRLIEDLAHARDTAANLYFQDPSFRVVVSHAQRRAEAELDFAIDRLYRLAKTLQYEWTEPYKNPVVIPINCQEAPSLENTLFDKFTELDSLFIVRTADESKDYLDALKAWDSKLRRINVISVRGPNHAGPLSAEPISLREQVLGFNTTGPDATSLNDSIRHFRDYLEAHRTNNFFNAANPSLEFVFSTGIADNSYFSATGSRWNMRIASISMDLYADSGFSPKQVAEVDLIENGLVSLRGFFADPPLADDLFHMSFNIGRADRSAFGIVVPAKINGATGGRPASEFIASGLANRPIAATRWILKIDTDNPSNRDLDLSKLKDIVIRFTYTYGNPPEFPGF